MAIRRIWTTPIEYKIVSGRPYLILKRKACAEMTKPCPFCGAGHIHGTMDGHRVTHCATGSKEFVTAPDGTVLYQDKGYILVTI